MMRAVRRALSLSAHIPTRAPGPVSHRGTELEARLLDVTRPTDFLSAPAKTGPPTLSN